MHLRGGYVDFIFFFFSRRPVFDLRPFFRLIKDLPLLLGLGALEQVFAVLVQQLVRVASFQLDDGRAGLEHRTDELWLSSLAKKRLLQSAVVVIDYLTARTFKRSKRYVRHLQVSEGVQVDCGQGFLLVFVLSQLCA